MADPRLVDQMELKRDKLSPLMRAKAQAARTGEVHCACPFGCAVRQCDEHGYCRHLVGFTDDGKSFEPMVREGGRRVVRPRMAASGREEDGEEGHGGQVMVPVLEPVLKSDVLARVSTSSRVYRDVAAKQTEKKS